MKNYRQENEILLHGFLCLITLYFPSYFIFNFIKIAFFTLFLKRIFDYLNK